ncbi:MAG: hypothetical protein RLZZ124_1668 [Cyanobacteriota bacterium]
MEEREGVALADLREVEQPPQAARGRGHLHGEQLVSGLRRRQKVTHGADAADARGDARHLGEGPPFAEGLEAAVLDHMEAGIAQMPGRVEVQADPGMALDAGHRIDGDRAVRGLGFFHGGQDRP